MMVIRVECPALQSGAVDLEVDDVTGGYELPATRGGVRDWAPITIVAAIESPALGVLKTIHDVGENLRIEGYEGEWLIRVRQMPGIPSDGLARVTLISAG